MTLQEALTTLTNQFPQDTWSAEIGILTEKNGERVYDELVGVGIIPLGDTFSIALVTKSEVERIKQKTGKPPVLGELSKA